MSGAGQAIVDGRSWLVSAIVQRGEGFFARTRDAMSACGIENMDCQPNSPASGLLLRRTGCVHVGRASDIFLSDVVVLWAACAASTPSIEHDCLGRHAHLRSQKLVARAGWARASSKNPTHGQRARMRMPQKRMCGGRRSVGEKSVRSADCLTSFPTRRR